MGSDSDTPSDGTSPRDGFPTTRWTRLLDAHHSPDSKDAEEAIATICEAYWKPLNRYVRAWSFSPQDADDIIQGFFEDFIRKNSLLRADPDKGKLRTFLLSSLKNYVINWIEAAKAQKRGGGKEDMPLSTDGEAEIGEAKVSIPSIEAPPDDAFDRNWAAALMERSVSKLEQEYLDRNETELFGELRSFLGWNDGDCSQAEVAERLGMKTSQFSLKLFRMRQRLRSHVVHEVRMTLTERDNADDELQYLSSLFAGS